MSIEIHSDGFVVRKRILMWVVVSLLTTALVLNTYYWLAIHDDQSEYAPSFVILMFLSLPYWFMHWALKGPRELFKASRNGVEYYSKDMQLNIVPWRDVSYISAVESSGSGEFEKILKIVFASTQPQPYHGIIDNKNSSILYFHMEGRNDVEKIAFSAMELRNVYVQNTR